MDADDDVEEAEEVGVDVAQEIAEAVPVTKENRASLEKRPSLDIGDIREDERVR